MDWLERMRAEGLLDEDSPAFRKAQQRLIEAREKLSRIEDVAANGVEFHDPARIGWTVQQLRLHAEAQKRELDLFAIAVCDAIKRGSRNPGGS